ncbi:MAG TPA: hypothetical protein VGF97_11865 [Rhizomicrobium sp.]|jgi:hypothetical protein
MDVQLKETKPKPTRRVVIVRIVFWALVFILAYGIIDPDLRFGPDFRWSTKIINPDEPGFNPEAFSFEDYDRYRDLFYTMDKMLPPGTPKSYVDHILTKQKAFLSIDETNKAPPGLELPDGQKKVTYRFKNLYRITSMFCAPNRQDGFIAFYDRNNSFQWLSFNAGLKCPKFQTRGMKQ